MTVLGIDVSSHQVPSQIDWLKLAETHQFVIARATYGIRIDPICVEHIGNALKAGMKVGLYHFYRQQQDPGAQLDAFTRVAASVGMGPGFIPPMLDLEANADFDGRVNPELYDRAELIAEAWKHNYGAFGVYSTQSFWIEVGRPSWWAQGLLWVAHWNVDKPATPGGRSWDFWQNRVAPLPGVYPLVIDQNVCAHEEVPVLQVKNAKLVPLEVNWDEWRAARDASIEDTRDD